MDLGECCLGCRVDRTTDEMAFPGQISRGLIACGHPSGLSMVAQIFELFEIGDEFAMEAASSLAILSDRSGDEVLSKANHAVVKVCSSRLVRCPGYLLTQHR